MADRLSTCLLKFGSPVLPMFSSTVRGGGGVSKKRTGSPFSNPQLSVEPFCRVVGVECEWSLADIRKRNLQHAAVDEQVMQLYCERGGAASLFDEDPLGDAAAADGGCPVSEGNRGAKVLVASTDVDDTQTYIESVSLGHGGRRTLVAVFPGRRDIVHASVSSVGSAGEVMVLFTERQKLSAAESSVVHAARPPSGPGGALPAQPATPLIITDELYSYRLYICATKASHGTDIPSGASFLTTSSSATTTLTSQNIGASSLPLGILDITPDAKHFCQGNGNPAYHVAYFIKSDDRKAPHSFILASDNTALGLSLQQAQFTSKAHQTSIRITIHEKWSLATNQFWHQWNPFRQQVIFAAHCVQFVKFRMIALDGNPDKRMPLFERNVKPQCLSVHQGSVLPVPFAAGNSSPNTASHFTVLPIRYECGTEDYALCSQVIRRGKYVRHTFFTSQVIVTITLLRNHLKEGRIFIDVPFRVRNKHQQQQQHEHRYATRKSSQRVKDNLSTMALPSHSTYLAEDRMEGDDCDVIDDDEALQTQHVVLDPQDVDADDLRGDSDAEWRVTFAYVRGLIAIIFPHGPIHFVDVAHKERCPTYLFGSSDTIFKSCRIGVKEEEPHSQRPAPQPQTAVNNLSTASIVGTIVHGSSKNASQVNAPPTQSSLELFQSTLQARRRDKKPLVLTTLPTPVPNIIFVAGSTTMCSLDLDGTAVWGFIHNVLQHRREKANYQLLLHTAVHAVATHLPPRADGYSLNFLKKLMLEHASSDVVDCPLLGIQQQQEGSATAITLTGSDAADERQQESCKVLVPAVSAAGRQSFSRCIFGPDVICELLLGECYGRVRAKLAATGCQLHLFLPISDDSGYLERQEELFGTLRLSCAAAKMAMSQRRALKRVQRQRRPSEPQQQQSTAAADASPEGALKRTASLVADGATPTRHNSNLPPPDGATSSTPGSPQQSQGSSQKYHALIPPYRFHQMLFHSHTTPPTGSYVGEGASSSKLSLHASDEAHLERPYSYGTVCAPSVKDVRGECSLTSDRWWTRHSLTTTDSGFLQKLFKKPRELPIQRLSFHRCARRSDEPFANYIKKLLLRSDLPQAECESLVALYTTEMTSLLDDLMEVVSQPPEILHPHKQILFLLNLCAALETMQFPWKGPLRHRVAKLILQHTPRAVIIAGIKSPIIPLELEEVVSAYRKTRLGTAACRRDGRTTSPWIDRLLDQSMSPSERRKVAQKDRMARSFASLPTDDGNSGEPSDGEEKETVACSLRVPMNYHKRGAFAAAHRARGWMHCAESIAEQNLFGYTTIACSSSLYGTAGSFDDCGAFDKQHAMCEVFPASTIQFYRSLLPLDGALPNYQPLRSFANWTAAADVDPTGATRRMQAPAIVLATIKDIQQPPPRTLMRDVDMVSFKRRVVADEFTRLLTPLF